MAKKKEKIVKDPAPYRWLDEVRKKARHLLEDAASLSPFDDVIVARWVEKDHIGIGIESPTGVYPSGSYYTYGARIYADKVIMFCDSRFADWAKDEDTPGPAREEYTTDMPRLWAFLRQLPRPMHSFGEWSPF